MTPTEAVHALLERGISEMKIAKAVGSTQSTINRLKRGTTDCNFALGEKLIEYATSITNGLLPNEHTEIEASAIASPSGESRGTLVRNTNPHPLKCELHFRDGTKAVLTIPSGQSILFSAGAGLLAMNLAQEQIHACTSSLAGDP